MNFNQAPYFDDFDETKQFYKILFKPGVAVQAREMNQLQSLLQKQISRLGDHVFKEGSMVLPGQINYNDKLSYLKLSSTSLGVEELAYLVDKEISQNSDGTGVTGRVIRTIAATTTDSITLIILYTGGNNTPDTFGNEFNAGELLYVVADPTKTITVSADANHTGRSAAASIQQGVYYLADHFCFIDEQVISVKKYADTVTDINARIGLQYTESTVTSDDDSSLLDNAAGSPNYAAPGADRYQIDVNFVQYDLEDNPENFFELLRIEDGVVQSIINASQYNILEETLARRTFDESGNYIVDEFIYDIREARSNNRGTWAAGTRYELNDFVASAGGRYFECLQAGNSTSTEPSTFATADESSVITDGSVRWRYTATPVGNRGYSIDGNSSNLVATFGIGKAYVQGYEIDKAANSNITIPKARETRSFNNVNIQTPIGNYAWIDKAATYGAPDTSKQPTIELYDKTIGSSRVTGTYKRAYGKKVGTANLIWAEPDGRGAVRVGLGNIEMNPGKTFESNAKSIAIDANIGNETTSYALSGSVRYTGSSNTDYVAISSQVVLAVLAEGVQTLSAPAEGAAFDKELKPGDTITLGGASLNDAAVSSWVVLRIISPTQIEVVGSQITQVLARAPIKVLAPAYSLFGWGTSTLKTALSQEYSVGDTVSWLYGGTATTGIVTGFTQENRMTVTSTATLADLTPRTHSILYTAPAASFIADVYNNNAQGINSKALSGTFTLGNVTGGTTTVAPHKAIRILGNDAAKLTKEVSVGDLVYINNNPLYITLVSSNSLAWGVSLEGSLDTSAVADSNGFRIINAINDSNNNKLIFPVKNATQSLRDNIYTVYKTSLVTGVTGASSITISLSSGLPAQNAGAESLATADVNAIYIAETTATSLVNPKTVTNIATVGNNVTFSIDGTFASGSVRVIYPVQRVASDNNTLGNLKTKTLQFGQADEFLSSSVAIKNQLTLSKTDIYEIAKVYMATSFVATWDAGVQADAVDVTNRYTLDDGQTATQYKYGKLNLSSGFPKPTGSIKVFYDYFEHGAGDFFARESYSIPYENIPDFERQNLGDVIDYRPSEDDLNYNPPRFNTSFIADLSYYLARRDKIFLDHKGTFFREAGVSSENPRFPTVSEVNNNINLYDIALLPYTKSSESPDIAIRFYDNRRYTMKDIGEIDRRVTQLEEATALSLLESSTKSLQIRDNLDPTLERYKTGFFVDNFSDDSNVDNDTDARYSLNLEDREMGPAIDYYSFPMVEKINYNEAFTTTEEFTPILGAREIENYKITGNLLTLDYTTSTALQQTLATRAISVAPFLTSTFLGKLRILPTKDVYENVTNVKNVTTVFTNTAAQAVAAYKETNNWRPYRLTTTTKTKTVSTTKTSSLIPFCRANTILLKCWGLRPFGKYYVFFDDENVGAYVQGAMRFYLDGVDRLNLNQWSASARVLGKLKKEIARRRSLYVSRTVKGKVKVLNKNNRWVYKKGWIRKTFNPKNYDTKLPSKATRDSFRTALQAGATLIYKEGGRTRGTGVIVHQQGVAVWVVNGRGYLSKEFLRTRTNQTYDYTRGVFYISVENKDPKYMRTAWSYGLAATDNNAGEFYSNNRGVVCALFDLPETDVIKFISGKKTITITDDPENHPDNWTSRAKAVYTHEGIKTVVTKNYVSTKTYVARPYDPIAQSFKLPSQYTNGAFITDIDVYFSEKPEVEEAPVQMEIRTCDETGRPSSTEIIPGSEVIKFPDEVEVDTTRGRTATKFTFSEPIYLLPDKNYAFVLKSDTKNYRVWVARLGEIDVDNVAGQGNRQLVTASQVSSFNAAVGTFTTAAAEAVAGQTLDIKTYTQQATLGSFFKSQDGTLWTEDQMIDMKFKINRAVFQTGSATFRAVNKELDATPLPNDPITLVHGSSRVRILHENHGFAEGDRTRLYSQNYADQYILNNAATLYGIPVGELFGSFTSSDTTSYVEEDTDPYLTVYRPELDSYEVELSTPANLGTDATTGITSVSIGGTDIVGQRNVLFHVAKPNTTILTTEPTSITFNAQMLRGFTYDGAAPTIPYTYVTQSMNFNVDNLLDSSMIVLTDTNEFGRYSGTTVTAGGVGETWKDSFIATVTLNSTSDHVSPALDLENFALDVIQHRIDNQTFANRIGETLPDIGSTSQITLFTTLRSADTEIYLEGSSNSLVSSTENAFIDAVPGRYVRVIGSTQISEDQAYKIKSVREDYKAIRIDLDFDSYKFGDSISVYQYDDYTDEETSVDATGESKFIINKVNLENPATQIKVIIEQTVPSAADFDVYYKIGNSNEDFNNVVWKKFIAPRQTVAGATSSYVILNKTELRDNFTDIEMLIGDFDALGNLIDLPEFTAFQLKFVMRSSNASKVPFFKNLRAIAHA